MRTSIVSVNDAAPTLLANGPGRVRFVAQQSGIYIGDLMVTAATGFACSALNAGEIELLLLPGEKCYAILAPSAGVGDVAVLEYGTP